MAILRLRATSFITVVDSQFSGSDVFKTCNHSRVVVLPHPEGQAKQYPYFDFKIEIYNGMNIAIKFLLTFSMKLLPYNSTFVLWFNYTRVINKKQCARCTKFYFAFSNQYIQAASVNFCRFNPVSCLMYSSLFITVFRCI